MSAVTLATLRTDFDRKRIAFINSNEWFKNALWGLNGKQLRAEWWADGYTQWSRSYYDADAEQSEKVRLAAQTMLVFQSHGREAAMLYKLTGGNIDPRKSGAQ